MVGKVIGPYRIVRLLGEGGMASVYEAVNESMERRVAIKVLHPAVARRGDVVDRFFNEARAVNRVGHPSIVQIQEQGRLPDGTPYVVMEMLDGETLSQRLQREGGRLTLLAAIEILWQVAAALAAAHAKGIVHRDLNPRNLMLVPDPLGPGGERVKVLDFGIAKLVAEVEQGNPAAALAMGTPTYMSPEQWDQAGAVDAKTDVYALGVMLFELIAARPPFVGDGQEALMGMHLFQPPPLLSAFSDEVPPELTTFVARLLSKEREQRPSMAEAADQLGELGSVIGGVTLVGLTRRLTATQAQVQSAAHLALAPAASTPVPPSTTSVPPALLAPSVMTPLSSPPRLRWGRMALSGIVGGALMASLLGLSLRGRPTQPLRPPPPVSAPRVVDAGPGLPSRPAVDAGPVSVDGPPASRPFEALPSLPPAVAAEALEQARLLLKRGELLQAKNAASLAKSGLLPEADELLGLIACQQHDEVAVSEAYRSAGWAGRQRILDACRQRGLLLVNDSQFTFQAGKSAPAVASPPATPSPVGPTPVAPPHPPPGPTTTAAHPTPLSPSPPPPGGLRPLPPGGLRPMPPPPPPKLVATSTNADRVLSDAQRENLQHNYARALQLARSVQQESPMRAWRTIGSAACGLKDRNLVKEAYLKLDQGGRQYLFFVCQHSGINTDAFNDPKH